MQSQGSLEIDFKRIAQALGYHGAEFGNQTEVEGILPGIVFGVFLQPADPLNYGTITFMRTIKS